MNILEIEAVVVYQAQNQAFLFLIFFDEIVSYYIHLYILSLVQSLDLWYLNIKWVLERKEAPYWGVFPWTLTFASIELCRSPPPPKPSANIWTMKPKCSIFFCFFLFCLKSLYKMSVSLPTVLHILPEFNVKYIFPPCWTPKKNFRKQCSLIELCNDGNVLYSESHVPVDNLKCDQCEWGSEFKFYWQN